MRKSLFHLQTRQYMYRLRTVPENRVSSRNRQVAEWLRSWVFNRAVAGSILGAGGGGARARYGRSVGRSVGSVRFGAGARARATRAAHVIFMLLMRSECASSRRGIRARRAFGLLTALASCQRLRIVVVQDGVLRVRDAGAVCKGVSDGGANGAPCAGCSASRAAGRGASVRVDRDRTREL